MDEEKLIRRKRKALNGSNRRALAEACFDLATYYYKQNRYSEALEEYRNEVSIYKELGLRLEWATGCRMMSEMYMMMAEFDKALKYEEKHLATAKELKNFVEEQRALATLGRIYLLQGQSSKDEEAKRSLIAAEKAFMKSLELCENLNDKVNKHELMDMRSRLLLNIGVVQEYLGCLDTALDCINKAITICSKHELNDVLHQCYMTEALIYSNKMKDLPKALNCLNKALDIASRLEDKSLKMTECLSSKADILCKMADYQSAKQVLLKAWKLKTPDEDERKQIESKLRVVAAMCYTEDLLISTDPSDHVTFKKLFEKLGDGACHLENYATAVEYYLKMLDQAVLAGDSGKTLIPIYVSIYQTYKDMGSFNEALQYCEKEYELIKDVPKEAYTTLYNIAELLFLSKKPYDQIEKACYEARNAAKNWNKPKYEIKILKCLLYYQKEYCETEKMEGTKDELRLLGYDNFDDMENIDDEQSSADEDEEDIVHIGDDICLDDLTDLSDTNEEDESENKRVTRRRGKGFTIKKNMKGETQLHVACISGNKLLTERLLAKGHPVNVRDNAGWMPLHEACINGHVEIANILINNGANINDRGGSNCDGITPLYDAASNGHLDVVQLLLEKGAIPSLKTDFGDTPLHVLQKWRAGTVLTKDEDTLYNNICNKIRGYVEKSNVHEINRRSMSKTPIKSIDNTSPNVSGMSSTSKEFNCNSPIFKKRNIIEDESDDEINLSGKNENETAFPSDDSHDSSDDSNVEKTKSSFSGVKEYKSAISALRNRNISEFPEMDLKKSKPKSALLDPNEVDDDWLEDDVGVTKNKKRKLSDPLHTIAKKPSLDMLKEKIDNLNRITEPLIENNRITQTKLRNDIVDISNLSSESDHINENVSPMLASRESMKNINRNMNDFQLRDTRKSIRKRWKTQSTLLKAGFQRAKDDIDECSNSGSDNELYKNSSNHNRAGNFSRKSSSEKINLNTNESFKIVNSINPSIMQPINVIQPISIMQSSKNGKPIQTQILPPAAVKVNIEDKVLLISLKLDSINKMTISWLVDEVKSRYYKLTGVRPIFTLMTADGAILSEDDPLSLVLSSPELKTSITTWKASPAEERYLECCDALKIPPSEEIQQAIGRSHTTHRLALGADTLSYSQVRPLFRALSHQTHITALMLSDNNLKDDGVKYLSECICTLKHLTHLDLRNNNISGEGMRTLISSFERATRPICKSLDYLDVSANPICDDGFRCIIKLAEYVKLKALKVNFCRITENALNADAKMNFDSVETIDFSNNEIKQAFVSRLLTSINPDLIHEMELDNIGVNGGIVGCISSFMDSAKELRIRRFSLSDCKLIDGQFIRIFRSLGRAKHLQSISLKQNMLTFITLKKLLQRQPPVPQIILEGCQDIFKFSPDSDFQVWLPAINFGRCIPEITVTPVLKTNEEIESFKLFSKTWLSCFQGRGVVEIEDRNVTKFTAR